MTTKELRLRWFEMTQKELSVAIGCPLRTVQGWDARNTLDDWQVGCLDAKIKDLFGYYADEAEEWRMEHITPFPSFRKWILQQVDS